VCGVCDRAFSQSNNLKTHMTRHGRGPGAQSAGRAVGSATVVWPCDVCEARFTGRAQLERHRLSHADTPRIIVVTPSGLRLTAQQLTVHESSDASVAAEADTAVYISSLDE